MGRTREKQVSFRLTEKEYEKLELLVKRSGLKKEEYMRRCVLGKEIINLGPLKELVPEMKKQGVNLNQIAKKLNALGYVDYKGELKETLKEVQNTWQSLRQYLHMHQ